VTYAAKIDKAEANIDWNRPAIELERQVQAFNPWPVAETRFQGQILRVWRAEALEQVTPLEPGRVLDGKEALDVATGHGILRLLELQLPGGKRITARDFLNAHSEPGIRLGSLS
jgi:methionyl-tRNA formyltransferase